MEHFRLIAIRTGKEINKKFRDRNGVELNFLKVLKPNTLYPFTTDYIFSFEETDEIDQTTGKKIDWVHKIEYRPKHPQDLYFCDNHGRRLPLYLSAIVGKNGSGKSTLLELLYAATYNFAVVNRILLQDEHGKKLLLIAGLEVEVFYALDNEIIQLKINTFNSISDLKSAKPHELAQFVRYHYNESEHSFYRDGIMDHHPGILGDFYFYTIGLNYSHYSLNALHLGEWIKNLFHKNDGYQTPVVLNPFRKDGVIDVNNEEYLTKSRLVANLLTRTKDDEHLVYTEVIKDKFAIKLKFKLNKRKFVIKKSIKEIVKLLDENKKEILELLFSNFYDIKEDETNQIVADILDNKKHKTTVLYILRKLFNITDRYYPYNTDEYKLVIKEDIDERSANNYILSNSLFYLIKKLSQDFSHITFKLRQALNYLRRYKKYDQILNGRFLEIDFISRLITGFKEHSDEELIYLVPPSFFSTDILFSDGSLLSTLSSGEKQQIYSATSYTYHILNINSVHADNNLIKYKYLNLVFDEIELYYHPELQRRFVSDLLENLSRIDMPDIKGINCLLVTHSPFILSDVPNSSVLKLDIGEQYKVEETQESFGANIHDLLVNDFFFDKELIGEFARAKIESLIKKFNDDNSSFTKIEREECLRFINIVGEPFLKEQLQFLYYRKFSDEYTKEQEIESLRERIKKLESD